MTARPHSCVHILTRLQWRVFIFSEEANSWIGCGLPRARRNFQIQLKGGIEEECRSAGLFMPHLACRTYCWIPRRCHGLQTSSIESCHSISLHLIQSFDDVFIMYALLDISSFVFIILFACFQQLVTLPRRTNAHFILSRSP